MFTYELKLPQHFIQYLSLYFPYDKNSCPIGSARHSGSCLRPEGRCPKVIRSLLDDAVMGTRNCKVTRQCIRYISVCHDVESNAHGVCFGMHMRSTLVFVPLVQIVSTTYSSKNCFSFIFFFSPDDGKNGLCTTVRLILP